MPRNSETGLYSIPAGTEAVTGTTISSTKHNQLARDLETDMNTPRPVVAGGTGASTVAGIKALIDKRDFADRAALMSDTGTYAVGTLLSTRNEGFAFEVVASGHDLSTAGGANLQVRPGQNGLDVRAFGAVGDGVTLSTSAIQAALTAAQSRGVPVFVPAGDFRITGTLTIPAGVTLHGVGAASVIRRNADAAGSVAILSATSVSGVTIRDLSLDGRKDSLGGTGRGIVMTGCASATISGVRVFGCNDRGIMFTGGTDAASGTVSRIEDCTVRDCNAHGIEVVDSSYVIISGNAVWNMGFHGIRVYGSAQSATQFVSILDNTVRNCAGCIAVPFVDGQNAETSGVWDVTVSGNTVTNSTSNGINVQARNATITGNVATGNGTLSSHQSILVNGWSVTVTGNAIRGGSGVGIDFGDCKRVICTGNIITAQSLIGIEVNSTEDFVVSDNLLAGNNAGNGAVAGNKAAGILIHKGSGGYTFEGNATNGVISGNVIRSGTHQQYGIRVTADTSNIRIFGNDAVSAGSVRDFDIQAPTGTFITEGNVVVPPTIGGSGATLTIAQVGKVIIVGPRASLHTINTDGGTFEVGRELVLRFTGTVTVLHDSGNIFLNGDTNMAAKNGSLLHLICLDTGNWVEISRRA